MRPSAGLLGLFLLLAPAALAQKDLPNLSTVGQPDGKGTATSAAGASKQTQTNSPAATTNAPQSSASPQSSQSVGDFKLTGSAPPASSVPSTTQNAPPTGLSAFHLTGLPTIAGVGVPDVVVPDTAGAAFMQKSNLPDGTVFICVGAALGALGFAVLAWRGLVAWSLHRSVKRAAMAQNLADLKAMSAVPGKKRGMYNVVGASSNMSLDRLSAAPTGTSKPPKPFANNNNSGTPPKSTSSLFFSPTAGGATGVRDSMVNRSSTYLPAGYYPSGNSQPASGSPMTHIGGQGPHLSTHSLATPGNRFSARSGISPPGSPSLPPSRGYDRAPPSRDGLSLYNRNSIATLGTPGNNRGIYGHEHGNPSQLSLNVPGGSSVAGGRAPSAYLEDLFENHGNGPRERF
jgi:hypothetical protein